MAMATIEKSNQLIQATNASVIESPGETLVAYSLPFGPDEEVDGVYLQDSLVKAAATITSVAVDSGGFLTRLLGMIVAFSDWLGGPSLSERDRSYVELVRARDERHWPL